MNNPLWMKIWKLSFAFAGVFYAVSGCALMLSSQGIPVWNYAAGAYFFISILVYRFVLKHKKFWPL